MSLPERLAQLRGYIQSGSEYLDPRDPVLPIIIRQVPQFSPDILDLLPGRHVIIIYQTLGTQLKRLKPFMTDSDEGYLELFQQDELERLLRGNRFIPLFLPLTLEEQEEIALTFNSNNLPRMLSSDPMTRLYGLKLGEIIKIKRPDSMSYRKIIFDTDTL